MEIFIVPLALLGLLLALGYWQTYNARQHVTVVTNHTPEEAARIVHDSFGRFGWKQVNGRGLLNYQARIPANGPVLSVSLSEVPDRPGVEVDVWMSEWESRYGMATGGPVATRQRKKILKAFDAVLLN